VFAAPAKRSKSASSLKSRNDANDFFYLLRRSDGTVGISRAPTLALLADLLEQSTSDVFAAIKESHQLLNKIAEVNDTSRAELLKLIETYGTHEYDTRGDSTKERWVIPDGYGK
jgi:hypothetical protein